MCFVLFPWKFHVGKRYPLLTKYMPSLRCTWTHVSAWWTADSFATLAVLIWTSCLRIFIASISLPWWSGDGGRHRVSDEFGTVKSYSSAPTISAEKTYREQLSVAEIIMSVLELAFVKVGCRKSAGGADFSTADQKTSTVHASWTLTWLCVGDATRKRKAAWERAQEPLKDRMSERQRTDME